MMSNSSIQWVACIWFSRERAKSLATTNGAGNFPVEKANVHTESRVGEVAGGA